MAYWSFCSNTPILAAVIITTELRQFGIWVFSFNMAREPVQFVSAATSQKTAEIWSQRFVLVQFREKQIVAHIVHMKVAINAADLDADPTTSASDELQV